MNTIFCPKCNKELNEFEVNKLWCTNCNAKFKSLSELNNFEEETKKEQELLRTKITKREENPLYEDLHQILNQVNSIKNMILFFVILTIIGIICNFITLMQYMQFLNNFK